MLTLADWKPGAHATREWMESRPRSIAVANGRIVALGAETDSWIGPTTHVFELEGRPVLPGINDGHLHFTAFSAASHAYVKMSADVFTDISKLSQFLTAEAIDDTGWIRGQGWDDLALGRRLTAKDLDDALASNGLENVPVVLFDWTGHALVVNSVALDIAGITDRTPDPAGGSISRDATGSPDGFLTDAAMPLLITKIPALSRERLAEAYLEAQKKLHGLGITALTEPGLGPGYASLLDGSGSQVAIDVLGDLAECGKLTMRVSVLALPCGTGGANAAEMKEHLESGLADMFSKRGIDPRRLKCEGVKLFADGMPQTGTSWHKAPVLEGGKHGHMVIAGDTDDERVRELHEIVGVIEEAGLQFAAHSVGDKTNEVVIGALAQRAPNSPQRHYLIHGTELYDEDLETMARNGIGWTANPADISTWAKTIPEERRRHLEPIGSALHAGLRPGLTSDAPVMPPDWRPIVAHAVTRSSYWDDGGPEGDQKERITTLDALALITREAAYRERDDDWRGDLSVGMAADLIVLDGPWPDDEYVSQLLERKVVMTMVGGEIVHTA